MGANEMGSETSARLAGMRERAGRIGAKLRVRSRAGGAGSAAAKGEK